MDKQSQLSEAGKKAYKRPIFQTYGNLAQITLTVGNSGNMDGTGNTGEKTAP